MIALREEFRPKPVRMEHFLKALKYVQPSLTKEDVERYERLAKELKRMVL